VICCWFSGNDIVMEEAESQGSPWHLGLVCHATKVNHCLKATSTANVMAFQHILDPSTSWYETRSRRSPCTVLQAPRRCRAALSGQSLTLTADFGDWCWSRAEQRDDATSYVLLIFRTRRFSSACCHPKPAI